MHLYICYAIMVHVKRGDCINSLVNIKIFHNNSACFEENNVPVLYEKNKCLKINQKNNNTFLDLDNNIFERNNSDYYLKVNFDTKKINLKIYENDLEFEEIDQDCYLKKENNIEISYCFDEKIKILYEFIEE